MLAKAIRKLLGAGSMCLTLAACVSSTANMTSNKLATYRGDVKRLLIVADQGDVTKYIKGGDDIIKNNIESSLNACGVITEYHSKNPIAVIDETSAWINAFHPDSVLEVQWKTAKTVNNIVASAVYTISLHDMQSKTVPWRATMDFTLAGHAGETFVAALISQMKADKIINEKCTPPALPKA